VSMRAMTTNIFETNWEEIILNGLSKAIANLPSRDGVQNTVGGADLTT
jgi:hypothetical protein